MKTIGQPLLQPCLGRGQINTRHANLGESKLLGPALNLGCQLTAIDLNVAVDGDLHGEASDALIVKKRATVAWPDETATQLFAEAMAAHPEIHDAFIELHGTLGAGKTTFVRHLLRALGVQGLIKSPTYAVVEPYDLTLTIPLDGQSIPLNIWHFDFYRFTDPREWEDAGFRDIFASPGLKIAEWPENAASHLPLADLVMRIDVQADETRQVSLVAQTAVGVGLLGATVVFPASATAETPIPFTSKSPTGAKV